MVTTKSVALFAILAFWLASSVRAAPPVPANDRPIAVRGGIVAIPLVTPPTGQGLPATVPVTVIDGTTTSEVLGRVVWLVESATPRPVRWTRSANPLSVRTLGDNQDPRTLLSAEGSARCLRVEGPLLLIDVPQTSATATLRVAQSTVQPTWFEPAEPIAFDPELGAGWRDDRPDPESPFEWFRWSLLAPSLGARMPGPPGDAATQMLAEHVAELWLAAIARVERQSKGVAAQLRAWLTATSHEKTESAAATGAPMEGVEVNGIASWIADAGDMGSLLSVMLDTSRSDDAVMQATLAWMDARTPITLWIDSDRAGRVTLMMANPLDEELVVKLQWLGEIQPPLATLIPARAIERIVLDRPQTRALGGENSTEPVVLLLVAGNTTKRVAFAPSAVLVRPPALDFGTFVPVMSLADIQTGRTGSVPTGWTTDASLRLRNGRWEVFAECFASSGIEPDTLSMQIGTRIVRVARDGSLTGDADPSLDASVREFGDRWRCRVTLPESWMPRSSGVAAVVAMGFERTVGSVRATAVLTRPCIDLAIPQVEIDVSGWSDGVPVGSARDASGLR